MSISSNIDGVRVVNNERRTEFRDETESALMIVLNLVNTFTNMCIGAVTFVAIIHAMSFRAITNSSWYSQHIYLCSVGYIILMTQAVMAYSPNNGWSKKLHQKGLAYIHAVMQVIGSLFVIVGTLIAMVNSESNFSSAHGIVGFTAMILTIISLIGGLRTLYLPNLIKNVSLTSVHLIFGVLTLIIAYIALCLAFNSTAFRLWTGYVSIANLCITITVIALFGIISGVGLNIIIKKKSISY